MITLEQLLRDFKSQKVFASIDFEAVGAQEVLPCELPWIDRFDLYHLFVQRWYEHKGYKRYNADRHTEMEHKLELPPQEFEDWLENTHKPYLKAKRAEKARLKRIKLEREALSLLLTSDENSLLFGREVRDFTLQTLQSLSLKKLRYVINREKKKTKKGAVAKAILKIKREKPRKKLLVGRDSKAATRKLRKMRKESSNLVRSAQLFKRESDIESTYNWCIRMTYTSGLIMADKIKKIAHNKGVPEYLELASRIENYFKK